MNVIIASTVEPVALFVIFAPSGDSTNHHSLLVALLCNVTEQSVFALNTYVAVPLSGTFTPEPAAVDACINCVYVTPSIVTGCSGVDNSESTLTPAVSSVETVAYALSLLYSIPSVRPFVRSTDSLAAALLSAAFAVAVLIPLRSLALAI